MGNLIPKVQNLLFITEVLRQNTLNVATTLGQHFFDIHSVEC